MGGPIRGTRQRTQCGVPAHDDGLDTIREVLLQTAVYAGVPAGNTGMAITLKVLKELGRTPAPASFHPPAEAG
jgi:hypothetical protein